MTRRNLSRLTVCLTNIFAYIEPVTNFLNTSGEILIMPNGNEQISLEDARTYMARKELFQLFESLLTGILYNRPERPVDFLDLCIQKARKNPLLTWDSFLDIFQKNGETQPSSNATDEAELKKDVKEAFSSMFPTEPDIKGSSS